jgi:hypothetical protein
MGFTQPLTEIVAETEIKMFIGIRARPVLEGDNLTAIYEPIVYTVLDP